MPPAMCVHAHRLSAKNITRQSKLKSFVSSLFFLFPCFYEIASAYPPPLYNTFHLYASAYALVRYFSYYLLEVTIMSVKDVVVIRIREICTARGIKPNELANNSGVTASTVYSLLDSRRRDVSLITIKKLCDGLDMTLGEFFSTPEFDNLEQEIY